MALVATASTTVRNKNILMVVLCAVFAAWFGYDGLIGWPAVNDDTVQKTKIQYRDKVREDLRAKVDAWPGWNQATAAERDAMNRIILDSNINAESKWHSPLDILFQRVLTVGLIVVTGAAVWWVIRCQKRRATADENSLSPAPGVSIPWEAIKTVDNTRWQKSGIVKLTYTDSAGVERPAVLDEYHLDNLRPILQELATRANNAQFIPPPETPADAPAAQG